MTKNNENSLSGNSSGQTSSVHDTDKKLNINSLICDFNDAQIRQAMEVIDGDCPLLFVIGLIDAMGDYIIFNDGIDKDIRETYLIMGRTLSFYLRFIKIAFGYEL